MTRLRCFLGVYLQGNQNVLSGRRDLRASCISRRLKSEELEQMGRSHEKHENIG